MLLPFKNFSFPREKKSSLIIQRNILSILLYTPRIKDLFLKLFLEVIEATLCLYTYKHPPNGYSHIIGPYLVCHYILNNITLCEETLT